MHVSLDGFVAGLNGEMDWIKVDEEIFDYVGQRISEGDTALYGRVTYEMMESYWPTAGDKPGASKHDIEHAKWYSKVHKVVLSKTINPGSDQDKSPIITGLTNTEIISDNLTERITELKLSNSASGSGNEILLFGSPTATLSLLELNLIDGYWLFVNPVILGQGIPLFAGIKNKIPLNLLSTRKFTCGVTELNYMVNSQ